MMFVLRVATVAQRIRYTGLNCISSSHSLQRRLVLRSAKLRKLTKDTLVTMLLQEQRLNEQAEEIKTQATEIKKQAEAIKTQAEEIKTKTNEANLARLALLDKELKLANAKLLKISSNLTIRAIIEKTEKTPIFKAIKKTSH